MNSLGISIYAEGNLTLGLRHLNESIREGSRHAVVLYRLFPIDTNSPLSDSPKLTQADKEFRIKQEVPVQVERPSDESTRGEGACSSERTGP